MDGGDDFDDDMDAAAAPISHDKAARRDDGLGNVKRQRVAQSAAARLETLRATLAKRESEWRRQSGAEAATEAVPAKVKNRDVVWRAMERMIAQSSE